jgi:25S rRNA (uracil2634-N3)-methyltransferase
MLIATSYESYETVISTYPGSAQTLKELTLLGVPVLHGVDATNLEGSEQLASMRGEFDRIGWNFPCVRVPEGQDGQNGELETNQELLSAFFRSAPSFLKNGGEVLVTHKTVPPFCYWNVIDLATSAGLSYTGSVVFDRCLYAGYVNRKVLDNKSFPLHDAQTYIFVSSARSDRAHSSVRATTLSDQLIALTGEGLLGGVVAAITNPLQTTTPGEASAEAERNPTGQKRRRGSVKKK